MSDVEIFQTAEFNLSDGKALAKSLQKLKDAKRVVYPMRPLRG